MTRDEPVISEADLPEPERFDSFHPFIKGVFSQWHPTSFQIDGLTIVTAEQWMMFCKARLFDDDASASAILATEKPDEQKRLGQRVQGFRQEDWDRWKVSFVYRGNLAKFSQNPGAGRQLKATGETMLVEANPRDWIWGVGLAMDDKSVHSPSEWKGGNLLGRVLTKVRSEIG
ncbi:NADAR family protein [Caulobacter soli]|uniref:NADAR family protein n=1 Tax=Caulobacter soli TaxID=2708539 RepID=UPI0013EB8A01|nr:NADAR family protein [Caulobacter soli]